MQANLGGGFPCSPSSMLCRNPAMFPCTGGPLQPGPAVLVGVGSHAGIPSSLEGLAVGCPHARVYQDDQICPEQKWVLPPLRLPCCLPHLSPP